ncbi:MAG: PEP-CTERM sorting domain-containing protein [Planctomycetia bacterium]|nr:PEP-CTERM sorting domain-containing protein [Planctomycetia bacterium]
MRVLHVFRPFLAAAGALALVAAVAREARAVPVTYWIDPTLSSITVAGDILATPVVGQVPGADITNYTGTISADLSAGVLTFTGGSKIVANLNTNGPFVPGNFGAAPFPPGTGIDNYGVKNATPNKTTGTIIQESFRDLIFDITTGTATNGFAPAGETLLISQGYGSIGAPINSSGSFVGGTSANSSVGLVSLGPDGPYETLVLPFRRESGSSTHFILSGQIVAHRVAVPEPSTLALAGAGAVGLVFAAWRRRRR